VAVVLLLLFSLVLVGSSITLENSEKEYSLKISTGRVGSYYDSLNKEILPERAGITYPEPGEHEVSPGSEVEVTAISGDNWKFSHWSGDISDPKSEEKEITIEMTRNKQLTANFRILEENEYLGTEKEGYESGENVHVEVKNDGSAFAFPIINVFQMQIQNVDTGEVVHGPLTGPVLDAVPDYGRTEYFVWNQTDKDGEEVPEGTYIVKAVRDDIFDHTAEIQISNVSDELEISALKVEPEKPREGEEIEVMVDVTNTGNETLGYTFDFYVNIPCRASLNESETVTVEPGETETISITFPAMKSGEYYVEVDGFEKTTLDFEVRRSNFLLDTWWLFGMIGFVIGLVIVVPRYGRKKRGKK